MAVIWITGAHGFIGRSLSRYLADQGHEIFGIGHGHWTPQEAQAAGLRLWLNSEISSTSLVQFARSAPLPETVYHLAGGSSVGAALYNPYEDFQRTVCTTQELLEWMRQSTPTTGLVAVSSAAVYGSCHSGPIPELEPPNPFSTYGFHKLMMETICRNYSQNFGVPIAIARLFSVYGPGLRKQLLWDLCCKLMLNSDVELGGTGTEARDWIHIHDACLALILLPNQASVSMPIFNLASGESTSIRSIAESVIHSWQAAETCEIPTFQLRFNGMSRPGDPTRLLADVSRLQTLGFRCSTPLENGLNDYVAWFRRCQAMSLLP